MRLMQAYSALVEFPELKGENRQMEFRIVRASSMVAATRQVVHRAYQDVRIRSRRPSEMVVTMKYKAGVRLD